MLRADGEAEVDAAAGAGESGSGEAFAEGVEGGFGSEGGASAWFRLLNCG